MGEAPGTQPRQRQNHTSSAARTVPAARRCRQSCRGGRTDRRGAHRAAQGKSGPRKAAEMFCVCQQGEELLRDSGLTQHTVTSSREWHLIHLTLPTRSRAALQLPSPHGDTTTWAKPQLLRQQLSCPAAELSSGRSLQQFEFLQVLVHLVLRVGPERQAGGHVLGLLRPHLVVNAVLRQGLCQRRQGGFIRSLGKRQARCEGQAAMRSGAPVRAAGRGRVCSSLTGQRPAQVRGGVIPVLCVSPKRHLVLAGPGCASLCKHW